MSQPSVHQLYRRLETIGKGAYGSVHKGVHISTGNVVEREVALLTQLRDAPNVTQYFGCYPHEGQHGRRPPPCTLR